MPSHGECRDGDLRFCTRQINAGVTNAMLSCLCDSAEAEPPLAADSHISSAFLMYQSHLTVIFF